MRLQRRHLFFALLFLAMASPAFAGTGGGGMPWNAPLAAIVDDLTGNTVRILAVLMFAVSGLMWGLTRHTEGGNKFLAAAFGSAIAIGAPEILSFIGLGGSIFP